MQLLVRDSRQSQMSPVWNETFAFVIDFAQEFSSQGFPVRLYFSLKDFDVFGENDDIGYCAVRACEQFHTATYGREQIDVSSLLKRCLHLNATQTDSKWVGLKKDGGDGKMKNVVGQNFKRAKVRVAV